MKASWSIAIPSMLMVGLLAACGGGGGGGGGGPAPASATPTPSSGNVQNISVNLGPADSLTNGAYTSVTVCIPNTNDCTTINNVIVDTGSFGLRLLGSALPSGFNLPRQTDGGGGTIAECGFFGSFFTWGPIANAEVKMAGETASSVPVQIISPSGFNSAPTICVDSGTKQADSVETMNGNGLLGIGVLVQDCGVNCTTSGMNPGFYYSCSGSNCTVTTQSEANQVQNPVASFATDNNGVLVKLPQISANGVKSTTGQLIFGIGTEANNGLGSATAYTTDENGNFPTVFAGNTYTTSYIDTGSNGFFFPNTGAPELTLCSDNPSWYCPSSTQSLTAEIEGENSNSTTVDFSVANADGLFATENAVFDDLAGPASGLFDWGLPFFFGRDVFVAIDGQSTPAGSGPYFAF